MYYTSIQCRRIDREEERDLIVRSRTAPTEQERIAARDELVVNWIPYIKKLAMRLCRSKEYHDDGDLVDVVVLKLLISLNHPKFGFDLGRGTRLSTWLTVLAVRHILAYIRQDHIIKFPMNHSKTEHLLEQERLVRSRFASLDNLDGCYGQGGRMASEGGYSGVIDPKAVDPLQVATDEDEYRVDCEKLSAALKLLEVLRPKEYRVISLRLKGWSQSVVAEYISWSRQRVQQSEARAKEYLRKYMIMPEKYKKLMREVLEDRARTEAEARINARLEANVLAATIAEVTHVG